jgi:hypothetical protein
MLQIDHVYEFLYQELFKDFEFWCHFGGVPKQTTVDQINFNDVLVFTPGVYTNKKILFYDQEPFIPEQFIPYIAMFTWDQNYTHEEIIMKAKNNDWPHGWIPPNGEDLNFFVDNPDYVFKKSVLVTSEYSQIVDQCVADRNLYKLYYFYHGFAALDWFRGHYALNYNKSIVKQYNYDFISFNRIINNDRSYRIYFVSLLKEQGLLNHGQVSFNVTDNIFDDWQDEVTDTNSKLSVNARQHIEYHLLGISKLVIDHPELPGSASADIPRGNDAFWHIVTETVFYYDKLHLTEKIFKPIVSKQPFMLLAAPGNLAYLKSYGFKTFDSVIDESYDLIQDPDLRTEAVVRQLHWYCDLTSGEKTDIIKQLEPIIDYNFHHFYGEFRHIITQELLTNVKTVFQEINFDDGAIDYEIIYKLLTN